MEVLRGSKVIKEFTIDNMTLADKIVSEARTWKNTRFQHQGRIKGVGVDCVNFVSEVAQGAGVKNVNIPLDYRRHEDGKVMVQLLRDHAKHVEIGDVKPGDVLALCDEALQKPDVPRHLAIVTEIKPETLMIIHASQHGVKEHRIDNHWRKRIHSVWRLK